MSINLSEPKLNLIKTIAQKEGFKEYDIDVEKGSIKGDGYLGIINTVHIQDTNNRNHELNLILKSAQISEKLREQAPVRKAYEREIFMYSTIFPEFQRLFDNLNITNRFCETAKCYGSILDENEESIVLENLREKEYKLWNRMVPMNSEHVRMVFQTYGKLHGTSFVLKTLEPERYQKLRENLMNIFEGDPAAEARMQQSCEEMIKNGIKAVNGNNKATQALMKYGQDIGQYFKELQANPEGCSVILHGDCWCNNMMFKYEDNKDPMKPTKVCLLDWQISSAGSPICDLAYFFFACASKDVFSELDELLKLYYDSLSLTLKQANCDPDKVFPFEELQKQWKKHCKFGLLLALMIIKVMVAEVEEAPDLTVLADEGKNILEAIAKTESVNNELYLKRIADVINFMVDNEFI